MATLFKGQWHNDFRFVGVMQPNNYILRFYKYKHNS